MVFYRRPSPVRFAGNNVAGHGESDHGLVRCPGRIYVSTMIEVDASRSRTIDEYEVG